MTFLRTISIRRRLWLILATALLCIVLTETKALFNVYQTMYTAEYTNKQDTVRSLVNSAHSLLERYYGLYRNGTLPEETAKQAALDSIRALKDGDVYFWINDSKPVLLMNASAPELEGQNMSDFTDKAGKYLFREIVKAGNANAAGGFVTYQWPRPGEMTASEKISFVRHFQPWGWYIGSGAYPQNIRTVFIENATGALFMTLLFVAVMAVTIRMINSSIADPLTAISRAMKNIANGNGDLTQRTPVDGDDEVTRLSKSFNQFVSQIHDIITESMSATGKVSSLGRDIASASNATRKLTDRQMQESEQVATGATEMSQTIQEIASNADKAAATVKTVESNARSGLHTMQKTQGHIADLASQIQSSRESIQSLREETESIGTVLDVIRGIAEQTNLLALNAAIEAARAGEQGRGFAVVADEVRTLASRTQESTEEIHRTISRLQDQAAATVSSMESSAAHSDETSTMSQQACDAIATISDAVVTLTEMNLSIASAVEQQSVAANEISRSINSIAESSGKINNNMSRADESGNMLEACSNNLSQLIARFKV